MAVLRDIVAKLSLDLDDRDFDQADKKISGTTAALNTMGVAAVAATAALGAGMFVAVKAAADANETLNLMGLTFQDNTDDVLAWGAAFSKAAGRSEFELREMATQLGSVLTPLLDNNIDQATQFAKALSERAVDFGSARNVGDLEAANAFISGLTGETEPLKRFGIVMTDASLNAFALTQGIKKTTAKMNDAEKTQLRYAFLMERTAIFQGDAANTSESYANATKALRATLVDLGTRIGGKFLPTAERVVRVVRDIVDVLGGWVEHSNIVQAALIVFGGIATAVALRVAATWALANLPLILMAIAVGVLILIVDDFLTLLDGGDSVIGAFIDSIFGPGSAAEAVANFKAGLGILSEAFETDMAAMGSSFGSFFDKFLTDMGVMQNVMGEVSDDFSADMDAMFESFDLFSKDVTKNINTMIGDFRRLADDIKLGAQIVGKFFGIDVGTLGAGAGGATPPPPTARATGAAAALASNPDGPNQSMPAPNQTFNIQVPAGTPTSLASRTADATGAAVKRENRRTRAALAQRGGG